MWLFRRALAVTDAAADLGRQASRLPLRLRERLMPLDLASSEAFELESIALVHAIAVFAIEGSRFDREGRDRLQDRFTYAYADRVLRLRLTGNMFQLHRPLAAVAAADAMRELQLKSHDHLDLLNLHNFLLLRLSTYRGLGLESTIDRFVDRLEAKREFEPMFSLAVFVTDSAETLCQRLHGMWRTTYLF